MASSTAPLHHRLLSVPIVSQESCPLFTRIPTEIRAEIFSHALADFVDPSEEKQYDTDSCYTRPSYFAPRKTDLRLLRTCRAIYNETWFLPFVLREQTYWLTSEDRAPPEHQYYQSREVLFRAARQISEQQGVEKVEILSLRVFAQMWALERGELANLLGRSYRIAPRCLTLTIRHADWWWWENDVPLRFEGDWLAGCERYMPESVREIHIELESLERKKHQVDAIAKQMVEKWYFKRKDGVALFPDVTGKAVTIDRWSGSSTWHGERWERDESAPGRIDYYIATVVFRSQFAVERRGGKVSADSLRAAEEGGPQDSRAMRLKFHPEPANGENASYVHQEGWAEEDDHDLDSLEDEDESGESEDEEDDGEDEDDKDEDEDEQ